MEFLSEFVDTSIYETLGMVDFYDFIAEEVDPLYPIGTSYLDFLEIAEEIDGIDHSSTVGKTVDKWTKDNAIVSELDQTQRLCEYDFSSGEIEMTWNVDPATLGIEDLYEYYVAGELQ